MLSSRKGQGSKRLRDFLFIHGDVGHASTMDAVEVLTGRRSTPPEVSGVGEEGKERSGSNLSQKPGFNYGSFDMALCQFALHYFCDQEQRVTRVLTLVSGLLKPGHRFCASFPNPYHILRRLERKEGGNVGGEQSTSPLCSVERTQEGDELPPNEEVALRTFGLGYTFTLGDAVQSCKEYIVPLKKVIEIAESVGLHLVTLQPLQEHIFLMMQDKETDQLREGMGVVGPDSPRQLSNEEWRAIGVYVVAAWQKV